MVNRRHLRIKVLQALYAYFQSNEENYRRTENELLASVEKMYELYLFLLLSFGELKHIALMRSEDAKNKIRPTETDLNPNLKFINNSIISLLENSGELRSISEQKKINWVGDANREMFRKMFLTIKESETYFTYMNNELTGFEEDKAFMIALFKEEIANSPLIYNFFEEKSIHWLDDIDLMCSMVLKTIKSFTEEGPNRLLDLYKDPVDEKQFIVTLLRKSIMNDDENSKLIEKLTDNWELDRIAKMDVILMNMAITELQEFTNIPKKVTLNEYIEISKFYSTPKSNLFINGILDKAISQLEKEGKIKKAGRGLMQ
jgi:transcription antitermination protein NusB